MGGVGSGGPEDAAVVTINARPPSAAERKMPQREIAKPTVANGRGRTRRLIASRPRPEADAWDSSASAVGIFRGLEIRCASPSREFLTPAISQLTR